MFYIIAAIISLVTAIAGWVACCELPAALGMACTVIFGIGYVIDCAERAERR